MFGRLQRHNSSTPSWKNGEDLPLVSQWTPQSESKTLPSTGFRKSFFPIRSERILSCAALCAFWRCWARCWKRPSSAYEAPWTYLLPLAAPSLGRCCLWYEKTCRQLSPAGDRCPTGKEEHHKETLKSDFTTNTNMVFLLLARMLLLCIAVPLWGSSHLSAL